MKKSPHNVIVGETYSVLSGLYQGEIVPIMHPAHKDGHEICVHDEEDHYHIDQRFWNKPPSDGDNIIATHLLEDIRSRDLVCRKLGSHAHNENPFAIVKLHQQYKNHTLKTNRCPHQGAKLVNGCGTCPFHGLSWNLESKRLRYQAPFFLRNGSQKWSISEKNCFVEPEKPYVRIEGEVVFDLVDFEDKVYPNSVLRAKLEDFESAKFSC